MTAAKWHDLFFYFLTFVDDKELTRQIYFALRKQRGYEGPNSRKRRKSASFRPKTAIFRRKTT
jgi:hypothetical protein